MRDGGAQPIVIVGGGLIGLLCAWYLAENGENSVLFDRQSVGKESSWAGGGILSPLYPDRYPGIASLVRWSENDYPRIVEELIRITGSDPQLIFSEMFLLDEVEIKQAEQRQRQVTLLRDAALRHLEPALRVPFGGAVCYPAAQVRNPRLLSALHQGLTEKGVDFREWCGIRGFQTEGGRLVGLLTADGMMVKTSRCILAAGAWTAGLLSTTGLHLPIKPINGQMLLFAASPSLISHILVHQYRYLIPRLDGYILAGSTVEDVGFERKTTAAGRETLYRAAIDLVPALADCSIVRHWAGLRPGSPDDAPFIGEHPNIKGLFVCAGHHRNGFATGPASARLVVDMMLGRQPLVDPTPFQLDRPCPEWRM